MKTVQTHTAAAAALLLMGLCWVAPASAQPAAPSPAAATTPSGFSLEGAVIDSRSSRSLGVINERGDINALFRAQKAMTFGILRAAGIPLDQLSPEVRARIERFATTNLEAFRAFSQGLDLKDQGRFAEAKAEFARAAQLDPGFALAAEQQQAMPEVSLGSGVQARAVLLAATGAAVDRGRAAFAVDTARAVAALAAGQTVVTVPLASTAEQARTSDFSTTPPGSGTQFVPNIVAGIAYTAVLPGLGTAQVSTLGEWRSDSFRVSTGADGTVLEALGSAGNPVAQIGGATAQPLGNATLGDGSVAYWGAWASAPGASATVTISGSPLVAPQLGTVNYLLADATRTMPDTGTAVFSPRGGTLVNATGTVAVNFATRAVELRNLGFDIGALNFSGLNGNATFDTRLASGGFGGNYSSGQCNGCSGFTPLSSSFSGHFVGRNADGLAFATFLLTGGEGTAAGVHLFTRPPAQP
ncbi:hypothetical protein IP87_16840 [beta proteobacterium AAP121]|nr:hypothetical protein IP80_03125 [beta proteobacterium AAP65]KPF95451.1 hypothetical protein IP87_16840 [beta proteobacterium AAP121]